MLADTLNPRVVAMSPSKTMAVSGRAKELKREGHPVIALSVGEPDFPTPAPIIESGMAAMRDGHTTYTENKGLLELRTAIAKKLERDNGLAYDPAQILCSNGAKQSVSQAITVLCAPGDEVIVPAPYWVSYPEMAVYAGARPVVVKTSAEANYRMTPDQLEAAISEKTRVLILCSPSNPTGSVYSREELEGLAAVLRRHPHVFVVSDEIYEYIVFDAQHTAFASLEGMKERTVTVNGFSKAYAMTGWRLGYMAGETALVNAAAKVQSQTTSAPSHITQRAGIAALAMGMAEITQMVSAFVSRRDFMLEALRAMPGVTCPKPEGAFYLFPNIAGCLGKTTPDGDRIESSEDLALHLLNKHYVALVPGEAFGDPEGIRVSYATSDADLEEAVSRLRTALGELR